MKISLKPAGLKDWDGSILIFGIFEGNIEQQLKQLESPHEKFLINRIEESNYDTPDHHP